jgi:hypothetical protein
MAGKKGKSGPPGNFEQRPESGARKALHQQDKCILPFLNRYADGLIDDAGGKNISSAGRPREVGIGCPDHEDS